MKFARSAFAVMLKLDQHLQGCLEEIIDAIDLESDDFPEENGDELDEIIKGICE